MSRRDRRAAGERGPVRAEGDLDVGPVAPEIAALFAAPTTVLPETLPAVMAAIDGLENLGRTAFEKLVGSYAGVREAKGETFAYAWMLYILEHKVGPGSLRAVAAAGVLAEYGRRAMTDQVLAELDAS